MLEDGPLAAEVRAMLAGSGAPRRVRIGGERRMPISGTLFPLDDGLIGMVLDAGAHEALAALADEQSALRRVATLVASEPGARGALPGRRRGGRAAAARALGGDDPLRGRLRADRRALGGRDDLGGFEVGTSVPLADSDGLTAIVARTGRARADRGLHRRARPRRRADARARLPLGGRRAGRGRRADLGARAGGVGRRARRRTPSTGWRASPSWSRWRWRARRRGPSSTPRGCASSRRA